MSKKYDFNYIVIGSGPAGSSVALALARAKKKVALVEGKYFGGSNLNSRDVPYGVALDFAHSFARARTYPELRSQGFTFSFPTLIARQLKTTLALGEELQNSYADVGIICLRGYANFLDKHTVAVGDRKFTSENFIIATGSHPKIDEISGTEYVNFLTPDTAIKVRRIPKAVMVVGGGPTGCEIAEYFAELGTKVLITEMSDRILPREDKEVSEVLTNYFERQLGINVLTGSKVVAIEQDRNSKCVIFHSGRSQKMVRVDCIVLATGSKPNLDCGLENAGVKYKTTGITVDKLFQTSAKNIYAVGDCIGGDSSTEKAEYEGTVLAANIVNKTKNLISYKGSIRTVKTFPAVVTVGLNEEDLLKRDRKIKKTIVYLNEIAASRIKGFSHGFVKLLLDRNQRIVGATIVAPDAELMAPEISLAIRHQLTVLEVASTSHDTNSWNQAIKLAAKRVALKKLKKK